MIEFFVLILVFLALFPVIVSKLPMRKDPNKSNTNERT